MSTYDEYRFMFADAPAERRLAILGPESKRRIEPIRSYAMVLQRRADQVVSATIQRSSRVLCRQSLGKPRSFKSSSGL